MQKIGGGMTSKMRALRFVPEAVLRTIYAMQPVERLLALIPVVGT